jgi:tetratricopeptide (TPR) repeat protein
MKIALITSIFLITCNSVAQGVPAAADTMIQALKNPEKKANWVTYEELLPFFTELKREDYEELDTENSNYLASARQLVTSTSKFTFIASYRHKVLYKVENDGACFDFLISFITTKSKKDKVLRVDFDTIPCNTGNLELGKSHAYSDDDKTLLYYGNVIANTNDNNLKIDLYSDIAYQFENRESFNEAIECYNEIVKADTDTLLHAAWAYGRMVDIYKTNLNDEANYQRLKDTQLRTINTAIQKYNKNYKAYLAKLLYYRNTGAGINGKAYSDTLKSKFGNVYQITFGLAIDMLRQDDFPRPEMKGYKECMALLHKTVELNPDHFNALLLLASQQKNNPNRDAYLKKMYQLQPHQFMRNTDGDFKQNPYVATSVHEEGFIGKDLTIILSPKECKMLGLN